jgi:hypothetical protein
LFDLDPGARVLFMSQNVLNRILSEATDAKTSRTPFLAVFDLDSTLFDLTIRMCRIVDAFADEPKNQHRFSKECAAIRNLPILASDWGLGEPLARIGLTRESNQEFYRELHEHWAACFFSDSFLHHDEPLPGAVSYVKKLRAVGAEIMYLTGRDVPRMLEGTKKSLRERGFPLDEAGIELRLKPVAEWDDAEFKVDVLRESAHRFGRIFLFENEPVNLNLVAEKLPDIELVYIDSCHSGREQVSTTLDSIKHFEITADELK